MRRKLYFGMVLLACASLVGAFALARSDAQDSKKSDADAKKDLFELLRQGTEKKSAETPPPPNAPLPIPGDVTLPPPAAQPVIPPPAGLGQLPDPARAPMPPPLSAGGLPPPASSKDPLPLPGAVAPAVPPQKPITVVQTPGGGPNPLPPIAVDPAPKPKPVPPPTAAAQEPIKLKGSIWSLQVDVAGAQTVVTATLSKRHEFKIVCQHVDLQTGAGVMKARGNVQITGDGLSADCEQLVLPLHDDRLVLESNAQVRIQKSNDARSPAFEIKGDKLDLRVSELDSARIETSWRNASGEASEGKTVRAVRTVSRGSDEAKAWTPYGTLRAVKGEDAVWSLVGDEGRVIAYLLARDGGSLEQYVGRTLAVYGMREGQRNGQALLRVTHIAVP